MNANLFILGRMFSVVGIRNGLPPPHFGARAHAEYAVPGIVLGVLF
jgi:hypothetical protein